jgi:hypothetical protein
MPYIDSWTRKELSVHPSASPREPRTPGELNYVITRSLVNYYDSSNFDYQVINDIIGALESAKLEFYRRVAAPYEDRKREQNGDVY